MVWALILVIVLSFPTPAIADEYEEEDIETEYEDVSDEDDSEGTEEPDSVDSEPSEPVSVEVVLPESDTVFYDEYGIQLMSTEEPRAVVNALSMTSPYASVTGGTYSS